MVYEIKILFLKTTEQWHLLDIAIQFKIDRSDIVRHINELPAS